MPFLFRMFFIIVTLMFSWAPFAAVAEQGSQAVDKVAKVGNLVITQADVDFQTQKILPMQLSFHSALSSERIDEIKQEALAELVERAYKIQYAIYNEISVDATVLEMEWQKKLSDNQRLADNAHTPQASKIKAEIYLELLAKKAEEIAVDEQIKVTDGDVVAYYTENKQRYFRPKQFTASHVFVKVDPSDNAEEKEVKRARSEALLKRALAGEDFYNLAYYESDDRSRYVGGSLGSFHAGQTVPEFDAAIQKMASGEITGPVRTMYGFHIIKLDTVEEERQLEFGEVSAKIRSSLVGDEREQIYEQWMSKLKEEFPLENFKK